MSSHSVDHAFQMCDQLIDSKPSLKRLVNTIHTLALAAILSAKEPEVV
jgi:hypothetical protein